MADTPTFVDMSSMAVGFGGFAPMPYNEVEASAKQLEQVQRIHAQRRESLRRAQELEESRVEGPFACADEQDSSTTWRYSLLSGTAVRIDGCETVATCLRVPESIAGKPVSAIAPDALAYLDSVTEIVCPDSVTAIGSCAFRRCRNLERLVLPANVVEFSSTWIQADSALKELVLPGMLERIGSEIFDASPLERIAIGPAVREIAPGAFQKSHVSTVIVNEDNPYFATDGAGLVTRDGSTFVALVAPVEAYEVPSCCTSVADKAFFGREGLKQVALPDSLVEIGMLAFAHTGIESFQAPSELREIGVRAFFHCKSLVRVELNEGIRAIGDEAFADSGISELSVPATIETIGDLVAVNTGVTFSGEDATFSISGNARNMFLGQDGGLYARGEEGIVFRQMLDPYARLCEIESGTVEVAPSAFARNMTIEHVVISPGVRKIEKGAFKGCRRLVRVDIPDSLEEIGEDAFFGTSVKRLRIPRALQEIGQRALVTSGPNQGDADPTLDEIDVDEGNERFFVEGGVLCERVDSGVRVVLCLAHAESVHFPEYITSIAPYAFNGIRGLKELYLNAELKTLGVNALNVSCRIDHIHVELRKPIEGRTSVDFYFPDSVRSPRSIAIAFGSASWVNVAELMKHYDNCVASGNVVGSGGMDLYDQARRIVERLRDPFLLTRYNRKVYDRTISSRLVRICVELTRHDDRATIDDLVELGYLNADNIVEVIESVSRLQDAAMTAYLLEVQRTRFNRSILDDLDL